MIQGIASVIKGTAILITIMLLFSITWYMLWVKPRSEVFAQIMDCMEDGSQEEYDRCFEHLKPRD